MQMIAPSPIALFRSLAPLENTSYLLSADLRIVRVNAGWARFAETNRGQATLARWARGSCVLDAISGELRGYYRDLFERALACGEPIFHDYECSSERTHRVFRMMVFPLGQAFLAVTHSLHVERDHDRIASAPSDIYVRDGIVQMCSHCRRVRAHGDVERWDWVPAYVQAPPPNISHGLCAPCAHYYFAADLRGE